MSILAAIALLLPGAEGLRLPSVRHGTMEARLAVRVEPSRTPGHAELTLTLEVEGPPLLEVQAPKLDELNDNWEDDRTTWASMEQGRVTWTQVLRLSQTKPGRAPTPTLTVGFRESPTAPWQLAKWDRILRDVVDGLEPIQTPPAVPPESLPWWLYVIPGAAVLVLVPVGLILRRYRKAAPAPPTPGERALAELARVEDRHRNQASDSGWMHTQVSSLLRRYLAERFEVKALQQTTAEFLDSLGSVSQLSAEQQAVLRDVLQRCDQARFARVTTTPETCQALTEQVRAFVLDTASRDAGAAAIADRVRTPTQGGE
jgi:Domain of unknown function (DUF4381)